MNIRHFLIFALASVSAVSSAQATVVTFSGVNGLVAQSTYSEGDVTVTSVQGNFWGYPSGGQLHLDPSGFNNAIYDFTSSSGLFDLVGLDVSFASSGAVGTFQAFDAANQLIGTQAFSAASLGAQTFTLANISRLRLTDTVSHFSIDNLNLRASATAAVPEPATWAMMLGGMGLVGLSMRRRKQAVFSAA